MHANERAEMIRACFLFADAKPDSLAALAKSSIVVSSPAPTHLFLTGDPADGLRVVLSGLVRIWIADSEGRELTLALLERGDPFGEIALLDGLPRSANATVVDAGECLFLPTSAVDRALEFDPSLARHLIQQLCEILRRNTNTMGAFAFQGLDGRLAEKLHDLALSHATIDGQEAQFNRRFSQTDLAQMLGVTREAVNKRLATLAHDELVVTENGYFVVTDLSALAARAQTAAALSGG